MQPSADRLEVTITDRGRGMGTSPDLEGPGLGLPLIAALADSLDVEEAPIRGNRLRMSFARLAVA
jgi:serine/threonine-protein kinase RsbW